MMGVQGPRINRMGAPFPYAAVSFDCYGTLVDWRLGMEQSLAALPALAGREADFPALIAARMEAERRLEAGGWLPYAEVLARSLVEAAEACGLGVVPEEQAQEFAAAQARWPAYADSVKALRRLAKHAPLYLLSNSDRAALQKTASEVLEGTVHPLVCAEDVQSYKPAPAHFERALKALDLPPSTMLHVSAYPYYDLHTAHELGIATAFVARDPQVVAPEDLPLVASAADLAELAATLGV